MNDAQQQPEHKGPSYTFDSVLDADTAKGTLEKVFGGVIASVQDFGAGRVVVYTTSEIDSTKAAVLLSTPKTAEDGGDSSNASGSQVSGSQAVQQPAVQQPAVQQPAVQQPTIVAPPAT